MITDDMVKAAREQLRAMNQIAPSEFGMRCALTAALDLMPKADPAELRHLEEVNAGLMRANGDLAGKNCELHAEVERLRADPARVPLTDSQREALLFNMTLHGKMTKRTAQKIIALVLDGVHPAEAVGQEGAATAPVAQPLPRAQFPGDTALAVGNLIFALGQWKTTTPTTAPPAFNALVRACAELVQAAAPAPVAQLRGYLLHWPAMGGGRQLVWSERDSAGVAIGCPVEPVYSFGVRKATCQEGGGA